MVPADSTALENRPNPIRKPRQHTAVMNALSRGLHEAGALPTRLLDEPHSHLLSNITHYQFPFAIIRKLLPPQVGRHFVSHPSQPYERDVVGSVGRSGPGNSSASQRMEPHGRAHIVVWVVCGRARCRKLRTRTGRRRCGVIPEPRSGNQISLITSIPRGHPLRLLTKARELATWV